MLTSSVIITVFLLSLALNQAYAKAGCCSKHGGVAGCDKKTNHQLCKDGSDSPTCLCDGSTANQGKTMTTTVTPSSKKTTTPTTTKTTSTTTVKKVTTIPPTKGCCAKHGGVSKCDTKTGYYACKDGTESPTCRCLK